jgi:hypothetical protein
MTTLRRNVLSVYAIISRTGLIIIASSRYDNIVVTARLNIDAAPATRTFQIKPSGVTAWTGCW